MERLGILTGADLRDWSLPALQAHFGSSADWYWRICRGIDEREVKPDRPYKSVSAERTFDDDLRDPDRLAASWSASPAMRGTGSSAREVAGRTVTLKVKFGDFTLITRSKSFAATGAGPRIVRRRRTGAAWPALHPLPKGIRLLGLGLHNLTEINRREPAQLGLAI